MSETVETPASHMPLTADEKLRTKELASRLWGGSDKLTGAIKGARHCAQARHLRYGSVLMDLSNPQGTLKGLQVIVPDAGLTHADVTVNGAGDHPAGTGSTSPTIANGRFVSIQDEAGPWWAVVREATEWAHAQLDKADAAERAEKDQARAERELMRSTELLEATRAVTSLSAS